MVSYCLVAYLGKMAHPFSIYFTHFIYHLREHVDYVGSIYRL